MRHLNPLEAVFWTAEDADVPMHMASVAVFEGPPPTLAQVRRWYGRKLARLPKLRQRVREAPLGMTRPAWEDDPEFRVADHVHFVTASAPGGTEDLVAAVERVVGTPLDRHRALWDVSLVGGLAGNRWAVVTKLHHAMADGIAGIAVLTRFFDADVDAEQPRVDRRPPQHPASAFRALRSAAQDDVRLGKGVVRATRRSVTHPTRTMQQILATTRGLIGYSKAVRPVPEHVLNGRIGPARAYRVAAVQLSDLARVRAAFGGSLNDVVLAMASSALRQVLLESGEEPVEGAVRCLVPVSVRGGASAREIDNRVSAVLADLPVEFGDPRSRYDAVVARTRELKTSGEGDAGVALQVLGGFVPPMVVSAALRAALHLPQPFINTVVTNVPGPREPRYLLGRRLVEHYPYVPIADRVRIGIAVTSYDDRLFIGVTGDKSATAQTELIRSAMVSALEELLALVPENSARR